MDTLTPNELAQISVAKLITNMLTMFDSVPSVRHECRILRLEIELDRLRNASPRTVSSFHASSLALGGDQPETCLRRLAYSMIHKSSGWTSVAPQTINRFEVGTDAHSKYQGLLSYYCGSEFQPEVPVQVEDLNIVGTCDGTLMYPLGQRNIRVGLEIKTMVQEEFKKLLSPYPKHLDQGAVYAYALQLPVMVFLYENKNNQEMKEFAVPWAELQVRWNMIKERVLHINQHLTNHTLPRRLISWWECTHHCSFVTECAPFQQQHVAGADMLSSFFEKAKAQ